MRGRTCALSLLGFERSFYAGIGAERALDAMIDRAIKRLIQIKAMKQMLRQASPERVDDQPRKFATVTNGPGKIVPAHDDKKAEFIRRV